MPSQTSEDLFMDIIQGRINIYARKLFQALMLPTLFVKGYHQTQIEQHDIPKTAVTAPFHLFNQTKKENIIHPSRLFERLQNYGIVINLEKRVLCEETFRFPRLQNIDIWNLHSPQESFFLVHPHLCNHFTKSCRHTKKELSPSHKTIATFDNTKIASSEATFICQQPPKTTLALTTDASDFFLAGV
ncbi:hypothetical protein RF11_11360 [Thelohanellus kitauei]|uniref:Reverse transcriptase/retrotransposon-derived protein RNase H-like domain-containing protein n=1 Tax=Thelohanellus kitauei TaxID=669202 RepID=A0A0C2MFI6_THEKT|nr:hypothetical protein RF11_11360 [Thelohanellus kitauei]